MTTDNVRKLVLRSAQEANLPFPVHLWVMTITGAEPAMVAAWCNCLPLHGLSALVCPIKWYEVAMLYNL